MTTPTVRENHVANLIEIKITEVFPPYLLQRHEREMRSFTMFKIFIIIATLGLGQICSMQRAARPVQDTCLSLSESEIVISMKKN